jgi:lycopene cyclase domain-containing protein
MGSYTAAALCGAAVAVAADVAVLRTRLVRQRGFWAAYAIVLAFQLVVNGALTRPPVVRYDPAVIVGWRIAYAPAEDVLYGFALVLLTLACWTRLGPARAGGRPSPGPDRQPRR